MAAPTSPTVGDKYRDYKGLQRRWSGNAWIIDEDFVVFGRGSTAARPAIGTIDVTVYAHYYDTDLGLPVYPDPGSTTDWVTANGAEA